MIPIRIKQFPAFVRQMRQRNAVLKRPEPVGQVFHLCFFSCHSYFSYLYCSLHSLVKHADGIDFRVLIFSDNDQPLSVAQIQVIQTLIPNSEVIPWPKSMGWGEEQIGWIWRAYQRAAEGAADNDYIARIDSDVFFFNDRIFRAVGRSNADLVGDGHFVNFEYCQGGCYFFKASAVRQIVAQFDTEQMADVLKEIDIVVEDIAAHHFAKRLGLKIWQTWFMMFPDELRISGGLTKWQRNKFSCAHFVMKNKAKMLEAYDDEVLKGQGSEEYHKSLDVV